MRIEDARLGIEETFETSLYLFDVTTHKPVHMDDSSSSSCLRNSMCCARSAKEGIILLTALEDGIFTTRVRTDCRHIAKD